MVRRAVEKAILAGFGLAMLVMAPSSAEAGAVDPPVAAVACSAQTFRVMTYNIRLDTPADGENAWAHRRALLVSQIGLLAPDIVGFQEVVPGQRADLVADLSGYVAIGGGRDDGKTRGEASPLFIRNSRFAIVDSGLFWLSPTPSVPGKGWDAAFPRIATWARLRDRRSKGRFLVVNTHWDHVGVLAREQSAELLAEWFAAHGQRGERHILLGDFNTTLDDTPLTLLASRGLADSRDRSLTPPAGNTASFNNWVQLPTISPAIDHIMVGKGLAVCRHHTLAETFDGKLASDHFPVIVDIARSGPTRR